MNKCCVCGKGTNWESKRITVDNKEVQTKVYCGSCFTKYTEWLDCHDYFIDMEIRSMHEDAPPSKPTWGDIDFVNNSEMGDL